MKLQRYTTTLGKHAFATRAILTLTVLGSLLSMAALQSVSAEAAGGRETSATKFDYVIIVAYNDLIPAVNGLKTWKERIGFSVKVVMVDDIFALYPTGDNGVKIWSYLRDYYHPDDWGIRYVLLVGEIDRIPMRLLYPHDNDPAYGSDFYYANLDQHDWDVDGDDRWGEFYDDALNITPEVMVGRIPVEIAATVQTICDQIVAFEQDTGAWKRSALLAHGIMDYWGGNADQSVLSELMETDFFDPLGWSTFTLYEKGGIEPTTRAPDDSLCQLNFENNCGMGRHGIVSCNGHGSARSCNSVQWVGDFDDDGAWDPGGDNSEKLSNHFSEWDRLFFEPMSAIAMLTGCENGAIFDDPLFAESTLRSRYLIDIAMENSVAESYLHNGSPATIAASAGIDYSDDSWTGPEDEFSNTLAYFFFQHLIDEDKRAGDSFYEAEVDYAQAHGMERGIRDYNFFGDPSVSLKGIQDRPGGMDELVHEGVYYGYAADNDDNGDMYVSVRTTYQTTAPGEIVVYKSIDHGENWHLWTVVSSPDPISNHDVMVSRFQGLATPDYRLHVIYTTLSGDVHDVRVQLADSTSSDMTPLPPAGHWATHVSITRDPNPMPAYNYLYAAWEYEEAGTKSVRLCESIDNGVSWFDIYNAADRTMPDLEVAPGNYIYLTMVVDPWVADSDVVLVRSTDQGFNFDPEEVLTTGDGANMHTYPAVAASTDGSFPAVWVAYDYEKQTTQWGVGRDLRCAYSPDRGDTWVKNRILSANLGVNEWRADLKSYRASANRWINIAYNADGHPNPGYRRNIIWRFASGGLPRNWSYERIVNDFPSSAPGAFPPRLVYSPGTGPGSGVIYGGPGGSQLYFSAPWLPGPPPVAPVQVTSNASTPSHQRRPSTTTPARAPATGRPLIWYPYGDLDGAFTVASLTTSFNGHHLLAAGSAIDAGRNQGVVYRSFNDGTVWQRLGDPPDAWSLSTVIETPTYVMIAGGFIVYDESNWAGVIYRSTNEGASWVPVLTVPGGAVGAMVLANDGSILAGFGWNGQIFRSTNNGLTWTLLTEFGQGIYVNDIIQTSTGEFVVALEGAGRYPVKVSNDGQNWTSALGLEGVAAAFDIADRGDALFVAVSESGTGAVYRGIPPGHDWLHTSPLPVPDIVAVRSVAIGPGGVVFAGAENKLGPPHTYVFAMQTTNGPWSIYGGAIDLANTVYCMEPYGGAIHAGTGFLYGNVYKCASDLLTGIDDDSHDRPPAFTVNPSYPNPFNPQTTIRYYLPKPASVSIVVYDVSGRPVRAIKDNVFEQPGWRRAAWDGRDAHGRDAPSGVYFYRLIAGGEVETGKLALVR